ncbi:rho GTPase-activating protein 32 [Caerostris extrusa]|uniref:Rho GTPase-activating protein 32 n=1 Tax=Caerostris extrusa TaxID=172846 RepID=A0AAV4MJG9_CAEEX|nr:rho GTPase-activating protein 32 [Caerostris extrusa]
MLISAAFKNRVHDDIGKEDSWCCVKGDDRIEEKNACVGEWWYSVQVTSNGKSWQIRRSLDNFQMLDRQLHRCVYDRKFSLLKEISVQSQQPEVR